MNFIDYLNDEEFIIELRQQSDRGFVLIVVSLIDQALQSRLEVAIPFRLGSAGEWLDEGRPLGSFSSKIALCHALGVFGDKDRKSVV